MPRLFDKSILLSVTLVSLAAVVVFSACGSGSSGSSLSDLKFPAFQRGNNLWVQVHGVDLRDAVYQQETDQTLYIIRPAQKGNKLAVVDATVGNDRATTAIMDVDDDGYTLLDKDGKEYKSINPFERREIVPSKPRTEPAISIIWGNFELKDGYGIRGAALFEVPPDIKPTQFRWETVDTIFVRFENR